MLYLVFYNKYFRENSAIAYRHMKRYECTVRIVVGCNSCCIYIGGTSFSSVSNLSPFGTACYCEMVIEIASGCVSV
jgi:hypothetical protein